MDDLSDLFNLLDQSFDLQEFKAHTYSPLALAYIGDSIYDLIIRTLIMNNGSKAVGKMHKEASGFVNANTQGQMYHAVTPFLTEDEMSVMKRGRNANSGRKPKNANMSNYKHATGFEALLGHLYITGKVDRVVELIKIGIDDMEERKQAENG